MGGMRAFSEPYTCAEMEHAIDALLAGDRKPVRRLYRRAFWWGFTHPFASTTPIRDRSVDHQLGICSCFANDGNDS